MANFNFKEHAENTLRAIVALNAPSIFKGMLNEFLHEKKVNVKFLVKYIEEDKSLWSILPPEHYSKLIKVMNNVGNIDWLTDDWIIDAVKNEHPAVASLFLSWRKSRTWLNRQIKQIKSEIQTLVS